MNIDRVRKHVTRYRREWIGALLIAGITLAACSALAIMHYNEGMLADY